VSLLFYFIYENYYSRTLVCTPSLVDLAIAPGASASSLRVLAYALRST
jgi:hypothetical protein